MLGLRTRCAASGPSLCRLRLFAPLFVAIAACSGRSTEHTPSGASSGGSAGNAAALGGTGSGGAAGTGGGAGTGGRAPGSGGQAAFALKSSAFSDMGFMSAEYGCGATAVSPPLSWTPGPAGTLSYAVVMVGPDEAGAASAYHWVIWDIPATTTDLTEGVAQLTMPPEPAGSRQLSPAVDGSTWPGYSGPCPLLPDTPYTFSVYALKVATLPGVSSASAAADVVAAIQANMLESAELTGLATHFRS
jgi:Raf kinase inhibitor-like YbhB/YbcL family protein